MNIKRITCLAAALVMSIGLTLPVYADSNDSRVIEEYWEDESKLTDDTSAPTLSFDLSNWKSSIHLTKDASIASLEAKQDNDTAYQGQSLKLTVESAKDITDLHQFSWMIRDENNKLVYPESENEDAEYTTIGIELHANEFGMNYFDGSMITFNYRINPDAKGLLMGDSCFAYACDDDYKKLDSTEFRMQYNDTDNNNTTQYAKGVMSIATDIGATKLVIDVPLQKATDKIDILYLDNLTITTRSDKQVANIDGYNANAKPQEIVQGLHVKKKDNTVSLSDKTKSDKSSNNVILYIGIGVIAVVVVVAIVIVIKKVKNRFY